MHLGVVMYKMRRERGLEAVVAVVVPCHRNSRQLPIALRHWRVSESSAAQDAMMGLRFDHT